MGRQAGQIAVYALTSVGAETARRIAAGLCGAVIFLPARLTGPERRGFGRLADCLACNFNNFDGHVVVAAAGIVVRAIAPLIQDKTVDPAVVVVDQEGRFAVSLLAGHLGGANDLALQTAAVLGAQAVITTATDSAGQPSLEVVARDLGLRTENLKALAAVSRTVVEGGSVPVYDPGGWLRLALSKWPGAFQFLDKSPEKLEKNLVWVGHEFGDFPQSWLVMRPPDLCVGLGCNRGTNVDELEGLLRAAFERFKLSVGSVARLASIEAKRDEGGLLELAERLGVNIEFFRPEELGRVEVPSPSPMVERHMGVKSVCEAAAMLSAGTDRLVVTKQKSKNATLAAAQTVCG